MAKDRRGGVVTRGRGASGRFIRITTFPDKLAPVKRSTAPLGVIVKRVSNTVPSEAALKAWNRRIAIAMLADPDLRAASIQARLRGAIHAAYTRPGKTGRLERGIFAKAGKRGTADGTSIETVVKITAFNYRELKYVTNMDGKGYFQKYPTGKYQITAKPGSTLKVPRRHAFFTAARKPGRGGGESRTIGDILGPISDGDKKGAFFFYPQVIEHPGFPEDVISDVLREEGARFINEAKGIVSSVVPLTPVEAKPIDSTIPLPGIMTISRHQQRAEFRRGKIAFS